MSRSEPFYNSDANNASHNPYRRDEYNKARYVSLHPSVKDEARYILQELAQQYPGLEYTHRNRYSLVKKPSTETVSYVDDAWRLMDKHSKTLALYLDGRWDRHNLENPTITDEVADETYIILPTCVISGKVTLPTTTTRAVMATENAYDGVYLGILNKEKNTLITSVEVNSEGGYAVNGLLDGDYVIFVYYNSAIYYHNAGAAVTVSGNATIEVDLSGDDPDPD